MSERFPGGFITNNPTAPTTTSAPGIWTLDQATQYIKAGTWPYGGPFNYIEDVFQTWLYTGTGANQSINNGVDLSTYGGLVWNKVRGATGNTSYHYWVDTARGRAYGIGSNSTDAQYTSSAGNDLASFTTTGYTLGPKQVWNASNFSGADIVSWTFRKQPKFFDVVTWTGDGLNNRWIDHSLASTPGAIIIKRTDTTSNWVFYHRSLFGYGLFLNTTAAETSANSDNGFVSSTSATQFRVTDGGVSMSNVNASGGTYVAYVFAHNAGGFGLTGTDNVISCGSFTVNGSGDCSVSLGYEPQWLMVKSSTAIDNWYLYDNMRGFPVAPSDGELLRPNTSQAGITGSTFRPTSTGFVGSPGTGFGTGIYIAIRRGPMKTPTSGTSVFTPVQNSNFTAGVVIAGQPTVDVSWSKEKDAANPMRIFDRLRGSTTSTNYTLVPSSTAAESNEAYWAMDQQNGVRITQTVGTGINYINYFFSRAPGFFDEVCYTGTGTATTQTHNLGVVPELMIVKLRNSAGYNWFVYSATLGNTQGINLNFSNPASDYGSALWNSTTPTSSVFSLGTNSNVNGSGSTYVAYLFASVAGVSKVGSYTGTGALQTINCGFTGGARWVMIKRTDSTGDWYVWDTARGMVSGTDPSLLLNSTAAEVNANSVYTTSVGFQIVSTAAGINASGGTYIFLAIA